VKIAAIDIGSNSIHIVIVEVSASGGFRVIDREKEMVRLGAETLSRGALPAAAMRRGIEVLSKYKRLTESNGTDKLIAVATSAIREARNGEEFLERAGREIGIWPRAVSGEEEARLIYLAALHSIHLEGKRALVLDIGGGSVELALGAGRRLELAVSEKLGVLRMTEQFVTSDPLSARDGKRLVEQIDRQIGPHAARIRDVGFEVAVGTSGTILALGAMAQVVGTGAQAEALHHVTVKSAWIHELRERLQRTDVKERLRMPALDETRADIIVAGGIILDTLLQRLGIDNLTLCEWALREGILLDYIHGHPRSLARAEAYPDVRRRSVVDLAERCQYDEAHSKHVASLALALFEGTRRRHALSDSDRSLLEYAALLHDIGHHISYPRHHKHSYYLIKNGDLRGFHPLEIEVLANVARYHRSGHPRKKHGGFGVLTKPLRQTVRILSGLLRIADALDRGHRQVVSSIVVSERGGLLRIRCHVKGDSELEFWGVPGRARLLEETLSLRVRVDRMRVVQKSRALSVKEA